MTELVLNLDDSKVKDAVQQAILAQLGDQARDRIIAMAITHLTAKQKTDYYGREQPSPLEQSFTNAVSIVANEMVREWVAKSPEVKARLQQLLDKYAAAFLSEDAFGNGAVHRSIVDALVRELVIARKNDE